MTALEYTKSVGMEPDPTLWVRYTMKDDTVKLTDIVPWCNSVLGTENFVYTSTRTIFFKTELALSMFLTVWG